MSIKSQLLMEELMVASSAAHADIFKEYEAKLAERERQVNEPAEIKDELLLALKNLHWAASERDKGNRIRMFDAFMDKAEALIAKADKCTS